MCDGARGLRGRGAADDGLLARPERPRRCTLPITALRVIPPSSPAIWLAERPSDQSFLRSSTRSSVQFMFVLPCNGIASNGTPDRIPPPRPSMLPPPRRVRLPVVLREPSAARDVVVNGHKTYNM